MRSPSSDELICTVAACILLNAVRTDGDTICTTRLRPIVRWVESRVAHGDLLVVGAVHVGAHLFLRHLVKPMRRT